MYYQLLTMLNFTIPDILWFLLKVLSFTGIVFVGIILFNYFGSRHVPDEEREHGDDNEKS